MTDMLELKRRIEEITESDLNELMLDVVVSERRNGIGQLDATLGHIEEEVKQCIEHLNVARRLINKWINNGETT